MIEFFKFQTAFLRGIWKSMLEEKMISIRTVADINATIWKNICHMKQLI